MCWRKEAGGGEGAADAAVKTKTPHDNVGNNNFQRDRGGVHLSESYVFFSVFSVFFRSLK